MKTVISILRNLVVTFPYIYFSLAALQIFFDHLNATGTLWSELLILSITAVFLLQLRYQLKHVDTFLGLTTFFFSCWMLLAVASDAYKIEYWTWTMNRFLVVAFVIMNFICSINLLIRKPQGLKHQRMLWLE